LQTTGEGGTITVRLRTFAMLRKPLPAEEDLVLPAGSNLGDLLDQLTTRYPGAADLIFAPEGGLRRYINILKNGRNIHFSGGLETPLEDGDTVAIFPPAGGG